MKKMLIGAALFGVIVLGGIPGYKYAFAAAHRHGEQEILENGFKCRFCNGSGFRGQIACSQCGGSGQNNAY